MAKQQKPSVLGIVVIMILVLPWFLIPIRSCSLKSNERALAVFQSYLSDYLNEQDLTEDEHTRPYINGKLIIVSKPPNDSATSSNYRGINSWEFFSLPSELRAKTPAEVKTVILMKWGWDIIGHYSNGMDAVRVDCELIVIDKKNSKIVGRTLLTGGDPPSTLLKMRQERGDTKSRESIHKKIVDHLKSLPRTNI